MFAFIISSLALGLVFDLAQSDSIQIAGFNLGLISLVVFASLIGVFTEIALVTIYRGNLRAGLFSGGLTGIVAFVMGRLLPPSNEGYQELHSLPSLIRMVSYLCCRIHILCFDRSSR